MNTTDLLFAACVGLIVLLQSGCDRSAEWEPGDKDRIREVVAEITDARNKPDKLAELFAPDAIPDRQWLKKTKGRSFVVGDIEITRDEASVAIDLEDHFGDVQSSATWKCSRSEDSWLISSAPVE